MSAPTENMLYLVGRKVFGFQKPPDHYRDAKEIEQIFAAGFRIRSKRYFPIDMTEAISAFALIEPSRPLAN